MFRGGDIPPVASRASMFDFNEPYTTVSFACPMMAASSSSVMSTALRKAGVASVELWWLAIGAVEQSNGCRYASAWRALLAISASVLMASGACLRASSWILKASVHLFWSLFVGRLCLYLDTHCIDRLH